MEGLRFQPAMSASHSARSRRSGPVSVLSTQAKNALKEDLGGNCFVCGSVTLVELAHIIPQKAFYSENITEVGQPARYA